MWSLDFILYTLHPIHTHFILYTILREVGGSTEDFIRMKEAHLSFRGKISWLCVCVLGTAGNSYSTEGSEAGRTAMEL